VRGTLGIHVVASAASPSLVRLRVANSFGQALTLRLADRADYGTVLRLPDGYEPASQPGRGLVKGRPTTLECQIALPAVGATEAEQTAAVRNLAGQMDSAWTGERPWRVRTLPDHVALVDLLPLEPRSDGAPIAPVGLAVDELEPLLVDLRDGPHFVITGPPRGGKSTLMRSWLLGLSAAMPDDRLRLYVADLSYDHPAWLNASSAARCIQDASDLPELLDEMDRLADASTIQVLAIDDLDALQRSADYDALQRLMRLVQGRRERLHVLLVGTSATLGVSYEGFGFAMKQSQTGFLVGGSGFEDLQILGLSVPHAEASQGLPPGRGFYARRKKYVRLKVAELPEPT
jgi:S-DNA-T family DNA segregation ATPase FtsK/SpoIIIE